MIPLLNLHSSLPGFLTSVLRIFSSMKTVKQGIMKEKVDSLNSEIKNLLV